MKINAAIIREKCGPFTIEEVDLEEPRADEVVVRVVGAGVCHTDRGWQGPVLPRAASQRLW